MKSLKTGPRGCGRAADSAGRKTEELAGQGKGLERRLTPGILRIKLQLILKPRSRKRT